MKQADIIIKNGTILTLDSKNSIFETGFLCIRGDSISKIGTGTPSSFKAEKIIDARGGLILPGLVNCHTHAAMSLFRGLADDLPLMEWLNNYIFPAERKIDAEFVYT
jgi:5-methylthioadenosine/S-adenosylhomocysteine deaminase